MPQRSQTEISLTRPEYQKYLTPKPPAQQSDSRKHLNRPNRISSMRCVGYCEGVEQKTFGKVRVSPVKPRGKAAARARCVSNSAPAPREADGRCTHGKFRRAIRVQHIRRKEPSARVSPVGFVLILCAAERGNADERNRIRGRNKFRRRLRCLLLTRASPGTCTREISVPRRVLVLSLLYRGSHSFRLFIHGDGDGARIRNYPPLASE